ncbi:MAG: hypothetical protein KID04_07135 [Clostridium sp.]|nr:hypothetical protein [Clostridium sp.]
MAATTIAAAAAANSTISKLPSNPHTKRELWKPHSSLFASKLLALFIKSRVSPVSAKIASGSVNHARNTVSIPVPLPCRASFHPENPPILL